MSTTKKITTEGADLVYDVEGSGPLLLLIVGGNGDSVRFTGLSAQLADRYTVVKYDRRANARSGGDKQAEMDMAQAGRDAAAVIQAVNLGKAFVFGNSAGANIALKLTQDYPHLLAGSVVHEPPISDFLPQPAAGKWRALFDKVYDIYLTDGPVVAIRLFFGSTLVGFDPKALAVGDQGGGDNDRFFAHEFRHINSFVPDLSALRNGKVPMVMAVGRASKGAFYADTAIELAERLPCPCLEVVGNHMGYAFEPVEFANDLHRIIETLISTSK